jgi:Bardet-Biedl syndrome 5 protein
LYRDLKLRGSIVKDGELILLPQEQIFNRINGVWNLSSEQGNLGVFFLTNVRIVWHANLAANFNVSLPYMQIVSSDQMMSTSFYSSHFTVLTCYCVQKSLRLRDSKFGKALVLETFSKSGGYILGFRVDPQDKVQEVFQEVNSLYQVYFNAPLFGVDFHIESETPEIEQLLQPKIHEDTELIDEQEDTHAIAAFYAQSSVDDDTKFDNIQYDNKLGLAVETLISGITLEQLWRVI